MKKINIIKINNKYKIFIIIFLLIQKYIITNRLNYYLKNESNQKRIGVINLPNYKNVGNILVKYSMFKKLEEFGFNATIITQKSVNEKRKVDYSFLNRTVNSHLLILKKNFSELNKNDYDYLLVNSDQTWAYFNKKYFFDIAFLNFAKNWKVNKFIYAASIGSEKWFYNKKEEKIAKKLLKNFTGISFREKGTVKLAKEHLNIQSVFVLDPTLLIDKNYYLQEIKNYQSDFNINDKYIFIYQLIKNNIFEKVVNKSSTYLNYKIYKLELKNKDYIESFIFGISNCQAVITDSFHGTIFSIIFNKPFISYMNRKDGNGRFYSLREVFNLENRILESTNFENVNMNLLNESLNINQTLLESLKNFSINYLKRNLDLLY